MSGRIDTKQAVELFDKAAALCPDAPEHRYAAAQLSLASGDVAGAKRRLRDVVRTAPGNAGARNDLAWLLAEEGEELDLAVKLAQEARRLDPSPEVLDTLGWVQLKRGETSAAVATLEEAVEARADSPSIRYRLGVALHDLNDPAKVIGVSDQWILQPEAPWEVSGYVPNVVFTCGAVPEDDGTVKIYWGGADSVMCVGTAVIDDLVQLCLTNSRSAL